MWDAVAAGVQGGRERCEPICRARGEPATEGQALPGKAADSQVIVVTDGQSSGNRLGHAEAIAAAIAQGVVVHVVCQKSWWDPALAPSADTFVKRLAEQTGGLIRIDEAVAVNRDRWDKPARIFRDIMDAIHNTYEIRLNVPDSAQRIHPLEVRTEAPNLRIHAPRWFSIGTPRPDR
jgi:hypothetical protein